MPVDVVVEGDGLAVDADLAESDAQALLDALGLGGTELSLVLCDDAFIRPLNRDWRGKDVHTDVLSFPQEVPEAPGAFDHPPAVLGDVVVSVETAARQAAELGHDVLTEVRVLLAHGLLHLVGHDHHDDEGTARMRSEEVRLLAVLGVPGDAALVQRAS